MISKQNKYVTLSVLMLKQITRSIQIVSTRTVIIIALAMLEDEYYNSLSHTRLLHLS